MNQFLTDTEYFNTVIFWVVVQIQRESNSTVKIYHFLESFLKMMQRKEMSEEKLISVKEVISSLFVKKIISGKEKAIDFVSFLK